MPTSKGTKVEPSKSTSLVLPRFVIIGAMRSGTSALNRYLDAHPDVFMSPKKEIHFFDANFDRGLDWYGRHFVGAAPRQIIGEATPSYMYFDDAIARMADVLTNPRLIAILRNPVDRAYSHYWLRRAIGRETLTFEEAIAAEPERLRLGDPRSAAPYLDVGRYHRQLRSVHDHFPLDSVLVVVFEHLRDDPIASYRSICRFLQIDPSLVPSNVGDRVNKHVTFRSLRIRRLAHRLPKPAGRIVGRLNTRRGAAYPPMDPSLRAELLDRFKEDNEQLAAWLGLDLSVWSR